MADNPYVALEDRGALRRPPRSDPGRRPFDTVVVVAAGLAAAASLFGPWPGETAWSRWIVPVQVALFGCVLLPFLYDIVETVVTGRIRQLRFWVKGPTLRARGRTQLHLDAALDEVDRRLRGYGFRRWAHADGRHGFAFEKKRAERAHAFLDAQFHGEVDAVPGADGTIALDATVTLDEIYPVWPGEHPQLQGLADELALVPNATLPGRENMLTRCGWCLGIASSALACIAAFSTALDPIWFYGVSSQAAIVVLVGAALALQRRDEHGRWHLVPEAIGVAALPWLHFLV